MVDLDASISMRRPRTRATQASPQSIRSFLLLYKIELETTKVNDEPLVRAVMRVEWVVGYYVFVSLVVTLTNTLLFARTILARVF